MNLHQRIAAIHEDRHDWTLKVRVTRMWVNRNIDGVIRLHNLILLDSENNHIHAIVYPDTWTLLDNVIEEGKLYIIRNIWIRQAVGSLRPVSYDKFVCFIRSTDVIPLPEDFIIPRHKFELVEVVDLPEHAFPLLADYQPPISTDIIGALENLHPVQTLKTKFGDQEVVRFSISDGSVSVRVAFWGPIDTNTKQLYNANLEAPVVLILSSTKLTKYRGIISVRNTRCSRIYINPDYPAVSHMRQRLLSEGFQPRVFGN